MNVTLPTGPACFLEDPEKIVKPLATTTRKLVRRYGTGEFLITDTRSIALQFARNPSSVSPKRLWKVFQYTYYPFDELGGVRIADDNKKLQILLKRYREQFSKAARLQVLYFKLLLNGYFSHGSTGSKRIEEERSTVREYLFRTVGKLPKGDDAPEWLATMRKYPGLLSENALVDFLPLLRRGKLSEVKAILDTLELPSDNWLFESLILRTIEAMTGFDVPDLDFKAFVRPIIEVAGRKYAMFAIPLLLNRYFRCLDKKPNMELAAYATQHWGSVYDPNAAAWAGVSTEVRRMVRTWLNNEFLEIFFRTIGSGIADDQARLEFMKKYANSIHTLRIGLLDKFHSFGPNCHKVFELKKKHALQFAKLELANSSALVVGVGDYIWVEFLGEDNACYVYRADQCQFKINSSVFDGTTSYGGLKHGRRYRNHVIRIEHRYGWQSDLRARLSNLGIHQG